MNYLDAEEVKLEGVLFVPSLKVNILSLGKLDEDGFTSTVGGGFLSIFDNEGKKFVRIQKTNGSMYLLLNSAKSHKKKIKRCGSGIISFVIKIFV